MTIRIRLPGSGFICDLEAATNTDNSAFERVLAGFGAGVSVAGILGLGSSVESMMCGNFTCFTEGTQVVVGAEYTEDGVFVQYVTINIEDVKVGDWVYSYNTLTGETELSEVTAVFVLESDHINYLTIIDENGNEQVIETTDSHPFWVVTDNPDLERAARSVVDENGVWLYHDNIGPTENGFWVEAKDLREGDIFIGANGEFSELIDVERVVFPETIKVYNFTVDGNHDYFVLAQVGEHGQTCVLVHNANCIELHHFATNKNHVYTPQFNKILANYDGLNLNQSWNQALLPHRGRHANEYHDFVLNSMKAIDAIAQGSTERFLSEFKARVINVVTANPDMMYATFWRTL